MFDDTVKIYLIFISLFFAPAWLYAQTPQNLTKSQKPVFLTNQTLSYFEDTKGVLSFDEVKAKEFKPVTKKGNNFGVSGSVYWFRFKLKNTYPKLNRWFVELAHPLLDYADFYRQRGTNWDKIAMGDLLPFFQRPVYSRNFVVPLQLRDSSVHTYYLRLESTSTIQAPITIYRPAVFHEKQDNEQIVLGVYYGILLVMALYNLFIFISLRAKSYLLYSLSILSGLVFVMTLKGLDFQYLWPGWMGFSSIAVIFAGSLFQVFMLLYTRSFLQAKKYAPRLDKILKVLVGFSVLTIIISVIDIAVSTKLFIMTNLFNMPMMVFTAVVCYRKGMVAARFFILAWVLLTLGNVMNSMVVSGWIPANFLTRNLSDIGGATAVVLMSLALADSYRQFKKEKEEAQATMLDMQKNANEKLEQKVQERTVALQEKSDEIMSQNEELQQQQEEIITQNEFIAETNLKLKRESSKTRESIQAAKAIQHAILPREWRLEELFDDRFFVIYKPKDIVSGDFYWVSKAGAKFKVESLLQDNKERWTAEAGLQLTTKTLNSKDTVFVAVVDCTGHGVPGAFMSMIGNSLLNEIVNEAQVTDTDKILEKLHAKVQNELKQSQESRLNHGMDVCLCKLEKVSDKLTRVTFTGAKRPLYYIKDGKFGELKGDRLSIGGWSKKQRQDFTSQTIEMQTGDMLYLTTDGYVDTPNPDRKSFGSHRLKKLLASHQEASVKEQKDHLLNVLANYQKDADQRDDITLMGIRI